MSKTRTYRVDVKHGEQVIKTYGIEAANKNSAENHVKGLHISAEVMSGVEVRDFIKAGNDIIVAGDTQTGNLPGVES